MAVTLTMDASLVNQTLNHGEAIKVVDLETPGFSQQETNKQVGNNDMFDVKTGRTLNDASQTGDLPQLYMTERRTSDLKKDTGKSFLEKDEGVYLVDRKKEKFQDSFDEEMDVERLSPIGLEGGDNIVEGEIVPVRDDEESMEEMVIEEDQHAENDGTELDERKENYTEVIIEDSDEERNGKRNMTPLQRFRHAAARVQFMCRVQINLNSYATEAGKGTFVAGLPDVVAKITKAQQVVYVQDNQRSKETITFNAGDYKTNHEFKWPKKGLQILEKKPNERTKEDIRTLCNLMRGLHSFRKYSRAMQSLICKVIRYQKYGRRRVVIRKGHPGYSFYFIFSGAVCVTLDEDEESVFTKKEVTVLRKGVCFGEIALLKEVPRMATIMCLEDTELLIVDRDEFFDNGLHLHIQQEFQYRLNFFRSMDIFSTWPIDKLEELSDMGRIEEYCYDSVVVKDSTENEWLLFVTKGRCDVLKLVDLAKIYSAQLEQDETSAKKPLKRERSRSDLLRGDYPLSLLPEGYQTRYPWLVPVSLPERPKTTGQVSRRTSAEEANKNGLAATRSKSAGISREESKQKQNSQDDLLPPELRHRLDTEYSDHRAEDIEEPKLPDHMTLGVSTIKGPDVDAGVYIRVNSLGPRQCFGLESITGDMPKLSLMSLGCEVIRVSLSKFKEYADEQTLAKIQKLTPKYPDNHFLWSNFREQNKWNSFKCGVVQDVMDNHAQAVTPNTFAKDLRTVPGLLNPKQGVNAYRRSSFPTPSLKSNPMHKIPYSATPWMDNKIQSSDIPKKANQLNSNRSTFGGSSRASSLLSRPKTTTNRVRRSSRPASTLPTIQTSYGQVDSYHPMRSYSISNRPQSVHIGSSSGPSHSIKRPSTSVRK